MTLPDPALQREVDARLDALTLDEQVALLSGQDFWRTTEIPHKVPSIKTTDGPAGARGENFSSGTKVRVVQQQRRQTRRRLNSADAGTLHGGEAVGCVG